MGSKKPAPKKGGVTKAKAKAKQPAKSATPKSPSLRPTPKKELNQPKSDTEKPKLDTDRPKSPVRAASKSLPSEKGKNSQPATPKGNTSNKSASKGPSSPKAQGTPRSADLKQQESSVPELKKELSQAAQRRKKLADELQHVEKQIFDLETTYLETHHPLGNALKGYEGLLTQGAASTRRVLIRQEDRLFSNSSLSGLSRGEKIATGASGLYAFK